MFSLTSWFNSFHGVKASNRATHAGCSVVSYNVLYELCPVFQSDECVERLQSCQFCEVELPWKDLEEHQLACGSRTELCLDCGRYVTLRDQPEHDSTCSATDNSSGPRQTTSKPPTAHSKGIKGLLHRLQLTSPIFFFISK